MEYTDEQIKFIQNKKLELGFKEIPSLDSVIVQFVRKYEVFVEPPNKRDVLGGAITGAVTGMAGADVGGDMAMIQGQSKQTKLQEWTSWKQWSLDHKEFPKFQTDFFNEVDKYNKNIDKKLKDPEVQKELDKLFSLDAKRIRIGRFIILIFIASVIGGFVFVSTFESYKNEQNQSSYKSF